MGEICIFLELLFLIMLKNEEIIYVITQMEEKDQVTIK